MALCEVPSMADGDCEGLIEEFDNVLDALSTIVGPWDVVRACGGGSSAHWHKREGGARQNVHETNKQMEGAQTMKLSVAGICDFVADVHENHF
jgi:hypothetical protein